MGAWGELAFDNDAANDWAYGGLDGVNDSLVESTFAEVEAGGSQYLDQDLACNALAACEVVAKLRGKPGYTNAYTEKVDNWVAAHRREPPALVINRGVAAIDRVLGENSELRELWEEADPGPWRIAVTDLRARLTA
jgi:hypothetical protein